MQGIFIDGMRRPKSKKEVREILADDPRRVHIEATSAFGNEYDGRASELGPHDKTVYFVGPDPYKDRRFYGSIAFDDKTGKPVVK